MDRRHLGSGRKTDRPLGVVPDYRRAILLSASADNFLVQLALFAHPPTSVLYSQRTTVVPRFALLFNEKLSTRKPGMFIPYSY